jgi:NADPH:quinone reductase-like Zn-dependent oxidoreductase
LRYTVEADGNELAEIVNLIASGKVRAHVERTYPLQEASRALAAVEQGDSVGKIVLAVA